MRDAELERLVRFCHPRKILAGTSLPGADVLDDAVLAVLYGTTAGRCREVRARLDGQRSAAAATLDAGLTGLARGDRVVALGDSITDDALSWAELLREALAPHGVVVVNAGLSGDTTAHLVARAGRALAGRPRLAIVLAGTNDARRHAGVGEMLVSHAETGRNLDALDRILRAAATAALWVTAPPVCERRAAADPWLRAQGLAWRAADVARKAALVRGRSAATVDLRPVLGDPPDGALLEPDGVHPSPAGQLRIAAAVLRSLPSARARDARAVRPAP